MKHWAPICSICQLPFAAEICFNPWTLEHGNNAAPVNDGKCCDVCNAAVVMAARLRIIMTAKLREPTR